jgi:hypothetical protein
MATRAIDLTGVPEPQAREIEEQVRYWKEQRRPNGATPRKLPLWKGRVLGRLTREELYEER